MQGFTQGWITNDDEMKGLHDEAVMSGSLVLFRTPRLRAWHCDGATACWRSITGGGPKAYWKAQIKLSEAGDHSPCHEHAQLYVCAGENDKALEDLKGALNAGCSGVAFTWLRADPSLDPLRGDPRFKEILKKVNLGE